MTDPLATVEEKRRLRGVALARRDALGTWDRAQKSERIVLHLAGLLAGAPPFCLAGYAPIRSEADILPLLRTLRATALRVALPVVSGGGIVFREWRETDALVPGPFGIDGPPDTAPGATPDVFLVPMLAFDRTGQRLGYGKGHYDRAIAASRAAGFVPRLIGVAFAAQEVPTIPAEAHDVRLDAIVTEDEVITP